MRKQLTLCAGDNVFVTHETQRGFKPQHRLDSPKMQIKLELICLAVCKKR